METKRYCWIVVALSFFNISMTMGLRNAYPVYLVHLVDEFGWSLAATSGVYSMAMIITALASPFAGGLLDRLGSHRVIPLAAVVLGLGLAFSAAAQSLWHLYLSFGVVASIGINGLWFVPHAAVISQWFEEKRGTAMGLAFSGSGIGIFLVAPLSEYLIGKTGWRGAFLLSGAFVIATIAPLSYLVFRRRAPHLTPSMPGPDGGPHPCASKEREEMEFPEPGIEWTLAAAARTLIFWALFVIYICTSFGILGVLAHQVAYLTFIGYSKMKAAAIMGAWGLISVPSRIFFGFVSDKAGRRFALVASLLLSFTGTLALVALSFVRNDLLLYAFAVLFGLGFGVRSSVMGPLVADVFGGARFGTIFGVISAAIGVGGALGPWLVGFLYDITGSYVLPLSLTAFVLAVGVAASFLAHPRWARPVLPR